MEKEGKWQRFILALLFCISSPDYTNLHTPVYVAIFEKYTDYNKMQDASEICRITSCSHIRIKPIYGNGESDSLCGKICDMHIFRKYAYNATIAYIRIKPACLAVKNNFLSSEKAIMCLLALLLRDWSVRNLKEYLHRCIPEI